MKIRSAVFAAMGVFAMSAAVSAAPSPQLMGYADGAEVIRVNVTDGQIDTISGVIYSQIKSLRSVRQLRMTLQIPRNTAKKPAIVYFPGGGFTSADHEKFTEMRYALARAGFVVAAAEYRPVPVKFPGLIEDAKAAVRYLRAHAAEYGIDPDRIGVLGDSAGGYVVQMLGATNGEKGWDKGDFLDQSSDVQAVVSIYGISDLTSIGEELNQDSLHASPTATEALLVNGTARDIEGVSILADKPKAIRASSIGHLDGTEPPFLIMHGTADRVVSPRQSQHLFEAMKKNGSDVQYVLVEGAKHGDLPWYQPAIISRVVDWYRAKLGDPAKLQKGAVKGGNL